MKSLLKKSSLIFAAMLFMCLFSFCAFAEEAPLPSFGDNYEITISADKMFLGVGNTAQFKASVSAVEVQPEIKWESSDDEIAQVNQNGVVKGKKEGYVTIIASAVVAGESYSASYPIQIVKDESDIHTYLENNNFLSLQYDYDYGNYYTNDKECWQKTFGYARVYDYAAPYIGMEYDYIRVFFDYDGNEFMIQLWKGQYAVIYGAEIGIYSKVLNKQEQSDPFTFYYAADEKYWPTMDMAVYHQENEGDAPEDYKLEFKRPVDKYWWCTGFMLGTLRECEPADELRTQATLTFNDEKMASLFAQGLRDCGFAVCEDNENIGLDSYYYDGAKSVSFSWQNISEAENTMDQQYNVVVMAIMKIVTFLLKIGLVDFVLKMIALL